MGDGIAQQVREKLAHAGAVAVDPVDREVDMDLARRDGFGLGHDLRELRSQIGFGIAFDGRAPVGA